MKYTHFCQGAQTIELRRIRNLHRVITRHHYHQTSFSQDVTLPFQTEIVTKCPRSVFQHELLLGKDTERPNKGTEIYRHLKVSGPIPQADTTDSIVPHGRVSLTDCLLYTRRTAGLYGTLHAPGTHGIRASHSITEAPP